MKRAIVYARVSTERQADEGLSIESQIAACTRKADDLGATVVQVFMDEGISGTTDARPGFQAAIKRCAAGDVAYLICWSSSRFARDQFDAISYKGALARSGARLMYASSAVDLRTQEGWLLDSIQQVMDENYSRQVSADTLRSMMKAAADGFFPGGRVPYGYACVPAAADGRRNKLVPVEAEAAVVRMMFERAEQGVGAYLIARQLNLDGITHRGRPWVKNSVLYLLKNEVNMGKIIYGRFDRKTRSERPPSDWVRVQAYPPLVEDGLFSRVQQALSGRIPGIGSSPGRAEHAFSGLLRCGCCGASLQMTNGTGRGQRRYHYYACRAHNQGQPCAFKPVRADVFDPQLIAELVDQVLSPSAIQAVIDDLDQSAAVWIKDRSKRRVAMVLELRRAEQRRDKLFEVLEQLGKAAPSLQPMLDRMADLAAQISKLEINLAQIEEEDDPVESRLPMTATEASVTLRRAITERSDMKALRSWLATIVDHAVVNTDSVVVHYRPECLIHCDGRSVRSEYGWLPVRARLRTIVLPLRITARWRFRAAA